MKNSIFTSLETSKDLKKSGWNKETHSVYECWYPNTPDEKFVLVEKSYDYNSKIDFLAPTLEEILEELPKYFTLNKNDEGKYCLSIDTDKWFIHEFAVEVAAQLWLELKKH